MRALLILSLLSIGFLISGCGRSEEGAEAVTNVGVGQEAAQTYTWKRYEVGESGLTLELPGNLVEGNGAEWPNTEFARTYEVSEGDELACVITHARFTEPPEGGLAKADLDAKRYLGQQLAEPEIEATRTDVSDLEATMLTAYGSMQGQEVTASALVTLKETDLYYLVCFVDPAEIEAQNAARRILESAALPEG
jgi:hypothetical protein